MKSWTKYRSTKLIHAVLRWIEQRSHYGDSALEKKCVGSCENHGTPGVIRIVRVDRTPFSKVVKPVRRYLAHTRADKAVLLYAVLHSAPGFREFAPLYLLLLRLLLHLVVQWNRTYNAILPVRCHCLNDAVTLSSLRPRLVNSSTIQQNG